MGSGQGAWVTKGQKPRRHAFIPDTQVKPGVPLDHLDWVGQALVDYLPDVIVHAGDHHDFPSLNGHEKPGSLPMEGRRFKDDLECGNAAWARMCKPMEAEQARRIRRHIQRWEPEKHACKGNHEDRADRLAVADPRLLGVVGSDLCDYRDWKVHPFLERVWIDGICYSHYFQSSHSNRPLGGEVSARLNRVGASFAQGHEQGFRYGNRITASGVTWNGLVAGSCYLHTESYRGAQGQRHWQGIVILNSVENGEYDIMPLSLKYLCLKYTGKPLFRYMVEQYPGHDWAHHK